MTEPREKPIPESCGKCGRSDGHDYLDTDCQLPHSYTKDRHPPQRRIGHCCQACVTRHDEWLVEIVDLYATLPQVVDPSSVTEEDGEYHKPRKAPASPAPVRLDAWALLNDARRLFSTGNYDTDLPDIPSVMTGWAAAVLEDLGMTAAAPETVAGCAALLRARADDIACLALVDEYDAELRWVRKALRRAHGLSMTARSVGRCPSITGEGQECGGSLRADANGEMSVWCARCGRRFNERFLRLLGGMMTA